jgi:drug/metabolite transporter (DMT)-like permease
VSFVFTFSLLTAALYAPAALSSGARFGDLTLAALLAIVGSAALHVGYFLALQRGYWVGDLSIVYPVARGGGPLFSTLGAILWFGERPSAVALVGTLLVIAATAILAGGGGVGARFAPGLAWGLATAAFIGAYTLWDARAVTIVGVPPLAFLWWSELARAALLAPAALARPAALRQVWREHRAAALVIATLSPLAYLLVLHAFTLAPVSLVAPMREASVLFGAALGVLLLGEGGRRRRLGAAVVMIAGVTLLARG